MRREPSFTRSRQPTRQQRLRRTILVLVGIVLLAGIAVRSLGTTDREANVAQVAFAGTTRVEGTPPSDGAGEAEAKQIRGLLNDWYQVAFANPAKYGDLRFPKVARRFVAEAGIGFREDKSSMTIGGLAPKVFEVALKKQIANVTVFFDEEAPTHATALVRFAAEATLLEEEAERVAIQQQVTLILEKRSPEGWVISNYYAARQAQDSIPATEQA